MKLYSIKNLSNFRRISRKFLSKSQDRGIYIDPYTFIGDSFIGLYFIDVLKKLFGFKRLLVLSDAYEHIQFFVKSVPRKSKILKSVCKRGDIIIMPDLIDTHWERTLELMKAVEDKEATIFIIGRNLIVKFGKQENYIFHYDQEDVLLRNKNIEEYMDDCLFPFVNPNKNKQNISDCHNTSAKGIFFVSPHSSLERRSIEIGIAVGICKKLLRSPLNFVYISGGIKKRKKDYLWTQKFLKIANKKENRNLLGKIKIKYYKNLSEMIAELKRLNVHSVLTSDTSIAHLCNRAGLKNITLYNSYFWDNESIQSLTSDSPLGFCRFNYQQYPTVYYPSKRNRSFYNSIYRALLANSEKKKISRTILKKIEFLKKKIEETKKIKTKKEFFSKYDQIKKVYVEVKKELSNTEFDWIFGLYDPFSITKDMLKRPDIKRCIHLIYSSLKIHPLCKFFKVDTP